VSSSSLIVNLSALERNLSLLSKQIDAPMLVIVKANGYGHGIERIGKQCDKWGVEFLGVVQLGELAALRKVDVRCKILTMGGVANEEFDEVHGLAGDLAVWRSDQVASADAVGVRTGTKVRLHLKLDTGMGRLGVLPADLAQLIDSIENRRGIDVVGVYSHFASADSSDLTHAKSQLDAFRECLQLLAARKIYPQFVHIANSPASLRLLGSRFNLVRLGIAAYGLKPTDDFVLPDGVLPIACWKTSLLNVKTLPKGHAVSYGAEFVTSEDMTVGVIPVGYADGFRRYPRGVNTVLSDGVELPVIGRICMDYTIIDLRKRQNAQVGDEIVLLGAFGRNVITAEELAVRWGTNNYDVLANIGARVGRTYVD
jgi:alanine racemase